MNERSVEKELEKLIEMYPELAEYLQEESEEIPPISGTQVLHKVIEPQLKSAILTKDLKVSNLFNEKWFQSVVFLKDVSATLTALNEEYQDAELERIAELINLSAEIIANASSGFRAKLLDTLVTTRLIREFRPPEKVHER